MDGRCWDEDALQQNLLPFDAEAARRIPLGRVQEDFWAWSGEKHGLYYVKSAYKLLSSRAQQARAHTAGTSSHSAAAKDKRWVKLWKQKVPPKVRVFWWRVMNDYMPCKANLYRRHVDQVASCELCGASEDTTYHVLIQCSFAHSFRRKLKNTEGIKLPKLRSRTWPEDLLDDRYCCEKDRVIILCGMWSLWNSRNDLHHARKPIEHTRAIDWAVDACFCLLTSQPPPNKTPRLNGQQWSSPPEGVLKINCDGGFQAEHMSRSIGVVMPNSEGSFIGASGRRLPSIFLSLGGGGRGLQRWSPVGDEQLRSQKAGHGNGLSSLGFTVELPPAATFRDSCYLRRDGGDGLISSFFFLCSCKEIGQHGCPSLCKTCISV